MLFLLPTVQWNGLSTEAFEKKISGALAEFGLLTLRGPYRNAQLFFDHRRAEHAVKNRKKILTPYPQLDEAKKEALERVVGEDPAVRAKVHVGLPGKNDTGLILQLVGLEQADTYSEQFSETAPRTLTVLVDFKPFADESLTRVFVGGDSLAAAYSGHFHPDQSVIDFNAVGPQELDPIARYFRQFVPEGERDSFAGASLAQMAGHRNLGGLKRLAMRLPTIQALLNKSLEIWQHARQAIRRAA